MSNTKATTHLADNVDLVHDLAVAQASFLVASLAPVISASIDRSWPMEKQREAYFGDLPEFTSRVILAMCELANDSDAMDNIIAMGLKITEERAKVA
jgi:hypothetical protein